MKADRFMTPEKAETVARSFLHEVMTVHDMVIIDKAEVERNNESLLDLAKSKQASDIQINDLLSQNAELQKQIEELRNEQI